MRTTGVLRVQTWQRRASDLTFGPHPQGSVRCRVMPPVPSPTHTSPGVQVVLVLLHLPTAWVATFYQAVGSEVHATNLSHQSLHLLVQDVKPDKDRENEDWRGTSFPVATQSPERVAPAFSSHLLITSDQVRGRQEEGERYADTTYLLVHGSNFLVQHFLDQARRAGSLLYQPPAQQRGTGQN